MITLVSEKELGDINFERLKKTLTYIKRNLFDYDNNMYRPADLLINIEVKEKLIIGIFILHHWTIYIHFMMEMG